MKTIKILLLLSIMSFSTSVSYGIELKDCSQFSVLSHQWNMCKMGISGESTTSVESKKNTNGFFKKSLIKIKNFGGKNIGEAD